MHNKPNASVLGIEKKHATPEWRCGFRPVHFHNLSLSLSLSLPLPLPPPLSLSPSIYQSIYLPPRSTECTSPSVIWSTLTVEQNDHFWRCRKLINRIIGSDLSQWPPQKHWYVRTDCSRNRYTPRHCHAVYFWRQALAHLSKHPPRHWGQILRPLSTNQYLMGMNRRQHSECVPPESSGPPIFHEEDGWTLAALKVWE